MPLLGALFPCHTCQLLSGQYLRSGDNLPCPVGSLAMCSLTGSCSPWQDFCNALTAAPSCVSKVNLTCSSFVGSHLLPRKT